LPRPVAVDATPRKSGDFADSVAAVQDAGALDLIDPRPIAPEFATARCPERGQPCRQPCPRETKSRHSRTKLSALLFFAVALTPVSLLLLCPASARAQGGVPLWTNVSRVLNDGDVAGLAVDSSGNVFVGGAALIKYSAAGTPLWTNLAHNIGLIAVDKNGNAFATAHWFDGSDHSGLVAYSSAGVPLWTNSGGGIAIVVDSSGNVFVTGQATIKYSNAGVPLWTNRYYGVGRLDGAVGIAVDSSGNVFVTGISSEEPIDTVNVWDFATVAYSNAGAPLWTNRYDGPANLSDEARAIAVDGSGNVFVTGPSSDSIKEDYATIAYSNSGVPLWTNRYNPGGLVTTLSRAIAVDNSGNVFVTGDSATVAYSRAGVKLWARLYTAGSYYPTAIAVDRSGNVFVIGGSSSSGTYTGTTFAYSNLGVPLWSNRVGNVFLTQMAVDRSGNVFVAGQSDGTNNNYVTIKYSSSIPPSRLDFQKLDNALVLSWTNAGFNLQTAPALTGPFTSLTAATSPCTNAFTGGQQFFRLKGD